MMNSVFVFPGCEQKIEGSFPSDKLPSYITALTTTVDYERLVFLEMLKDSDPVILLSAMMKNILFFRLQKPVQMPVLVVGCIYLTLKSMSRQSNELNKKTKILTL